MTFDKAASTIQQTAAAALPSAAGKTIADVTSSLNNLAGSGGAVSADALGAVALGKVFNPFSEQIFNSMGFRSHNFSFKLFARSKKEAQMIRKIVTYLKTGTAPRIAGGSGLDMFKFQSDDPEKNASDAEAQAEAQAQIDATVGSAVTSARFFEVPDKYSIKFVLPIFKNCLGILEPSLFPSPPANNISAFFIYIYYFFIFLLLDYLLYIFMLIQKKNL